MTVEKSLELDVDEVGHGERTARVARVAVVASRAMTRKAGAPTITADCTQLAAFEREVERLQGELEEAVAQAREAFGGEAPAAARGEAEQAPQAQPSGSAPAIGEAWTVADLLSPDVQTVGPNDPLARAEGLMREHGFRHVVVVDERGVVVGLLSDRDIHYGALAWSLGEGRVAYEKRLAATKVKEVMTARVETIDPAQPLRAAATLMRRRGIGCLPVVEGERLVGVVTEGDFVALWDADSAGR